MVNKEQNVQESDTTEVEENNKVDNINIPGSIRKK